MRILLSQSYFRVLDPKEHRRHMPYPPLGTLYAATILRDMGHDVKVFDAMLAERVRDFEPQFESFDPELLIVYDDEFNYLTKMCLSNMRSAALEQLEIAGEFDVTSLVYSSDATDHSQLYLEADAAAIMAGEGEITLKETVEAIADLEEKRAEIPGLRWLEDGKVRWSQPRKVLTDLDVLPDPDFSFLDLDAYRSEWEKNHGFFSLNLSTTRGCPFHCNWCAKPIYGQVYHSRSAERVAAQIRQMRDDYLMDHIWITDDIFGLTPGWLTEFAAECEKIDVRVPFKCLSRADLLLRGATIDELRRTGCEDIWIGAESGSQKILDAMDKGTTVEQIYESARLAKEAGMKISFFLQFGYTGEDWDDIHLTRKMVKDCMPDDIGISVSYPLPGTPFYERVQNQMTKTNWTDSDDLAMMFDGTYEPDFYRILHRFIHAEYRMRKIWKRKQVLRTPHMAFYAMQKARLGRKMRPFLKAAAT